MPVFSVRAPNGSTYTVNGPDGSTIEDAYAYVSARLSAAGLDPTKQWDDREKALSQRAETFAQKSNPISQVRDIGGRAVGGLVSTFGGAIDMLSPDAGGDVTGAESFVRKVTPDWLESATFGATPLGIGARAVNAVGRGLMGMRAAAQEHVGAPLAEWMGKDAEAAMLRADAEKYTGKLIDAQAQEDARRAAAGMPSVTQENRDSIANRIGGAISDFGQDVKDYWTSEESRAQQQDIGQAIQKDGARGIANYIGNPLNPANLPNYAALGDMVAPSLLEFAAPGGLAGRAVKAGRAAEAAATVEQVAARAAAEGVDELTRVSRVSEALASAKVAERGAETAARNTMLGVQTAQTTEVNARDNAQQILSAPIEELRKNADFQRAAQVMGEDAARDWLAQRTFETTFAAGLPVNALLQFGAGAVGAQPFESAVAGAGRGAARTGIGAAIDAAPGVRGRALRMMADGAKEAAGEAAQEYGEQVSQNFGGIDAGLAGSLTEGAGAGALIGAIAGGATGGITGALSGASRPPTAAERGALVAEEALNIAQRYAPTPPSPEATENVASPAVSPTIVPEMEQPLGPVAEPADDIEQMIGAQSFTQEATDGQANPLESGGLAGAMPAAPGAAQAPGVPAGGDQAVQPAKSLSEVRDALAQRYVRAEQVKPRFDADITEIAGLVGGRPITADLKGEDRALAKITKDYASEAHPYGDVSQIKDLVRGTIEMPSTLDADTVFAKLKEKYGEPIKFKNGLDPSKPPLAANGYRDINSVWMIDGEPVELQINLPEMLDAKKKAHPLYVEYSEIKRNAEGRQPTEKELAELDRLDAAQAEIYGAAWDSAMRRMNSSLGIKSASERNSMPGKTLPDGNERAVWRSSQASDPSGMTPNMALGENSAGSTVDSIGSTSTPIVPKTDPKSDLIPFPEDSGSLGIPRAQMPQIKQKDRDGFLKYLADMGITGRKGRVPAASLKPTQSEYSPSGVERFMQNGPMNGERAVLVSQDGYVLDGHHQWMAHRTKGDSVPAIRFNAPIRELLAATEAFPNVQRSPTFGVSTDAAHAFEMGAAGEAFTSTNERIPFRYALAEESALVASNDPDGRVNPAYPQALQPRDRTSPESRTQVQSIAGNLQPERLGESADIVNGAPMVGPDGVVESGNGRVMALQSAPEPRRAAYRKWLRNNARRFGIDPEVLAGMKSPVLVRVREGDMSPEARIKIGQDGNRGTQQAMNPVESARADARLIDDDMMGLFLPSEDGDVLAASNQPFLRAFAQRIGGMEAAGLSSDGRWTKQMADRVNAAVFWRAYGDPRLLQAFAAEADPDMKNILSALGSGAREFALARSEGAADAGLDAGRLFADAVGIIRDARERGMSVPALLGQGSLFGNTYEPLAAKVATWMAENIRRHRQLGDALVEMGREIRAELSSRASGDMFDRADVGMTEIANEAIQRQADRNRDPQQGRALFSEARRAAAPVDRQDQRQESWRGADAAAADAAPRREAVALQRHAARLQAAVTAALTIAGEGRKGSAKARVFATVQDARDAGFEVDLDADGFFDPGTGTVGIIAESVPDTARAMWIAFHEQSAHLGLRETFPDAPALAAELDRAGRNPTVRALADALAADRGLTSAQDGLAVEEALAELQAARRTGNWSEIADRYGVAVDDFGRQGIADTMRRMLRALRAALGLRGAKPAAYSDADVMKLLEDAHRAGLRSDGSRGQDGAVMASTRDTSRDALESVDNAGMAGDDYRGEHQAPTKGSGAPGHDVTGGGSFYPDDVYGPNGLRYYGTGEDAMDAEAYAVIRRLKGHPNHNVTIYRAVPKSVKGGIRAGDWVTTVRRYAVDHGRGALSGDYKIQSKVVRANEIFTNGDSWLEWGYDPQPFDMDDLRAARERRAEKQRQNDALESTEDQTQSNPSILKSTVRAQAVPAARERAEARRRTADAALGNPTEGGVLGYSPARSEWVGWRGAVRKAREAMQDKLIALRDTQQDIEAARGEALPDEQNVYRIENLMYGRVGKGMDALEEVLIEPLFKAMRRAKVTPEALEEYLYARHAKERNADLRADNPDIVAGSGMTDAEADAILAKSAGLEPLAKMVDRITQDTRRRLYQHGIITKSQYEAMQAQFKHYVPLRGKEDASALDKAFRKSGLGGGGVELRSAGIKAMTGRNSRAVNILGEVIGDAQRSVIAAEKARVGRALARLVLANPNPNLWTFEPVRTERQKDPKTGEVFEKVLNESASPDVVMVRIKGQLYRIQFTNPKVAAALKNVGADVQLNALGRALQAINRYVSATLTSYNPGFVAVNLARDAVFGSARILTEHGPKLYGSTMGHYGGAVKALARAARGKGEAPMLAEFLAAGGKTGWVTSAAVDTLQKQVRLDAKTGKVADAVRAAKALAEVVEEANSVVENAMRLAYYSALRDAGWSVDSAAEKAKDLTVNFNRQGTYGPLLKVMFLFYNPGVQGAHQVVKALKHPRMQGAMFALGLAQFSLAMLAAGYEDDDGERLSDKVPDSVKQRNLWLALPGEDGDPARIYTLPMPYGFNAFSFLGGRLAQAMTSDAKAIASNTKTVRQVVGDFTGDMLLTIAQAFSPVPIDEGLIGFIPTIPLKAAGELAMNRDGLGRRIRNESPYDQTTPLAMIGKADTHELFKAAARGLNFIGLGDEYHKPMAPFDWAPEDIEYMYGLATGGAGRSIMDFITLGHDWATGQDRAQKASPMIRSFTRPVNDVSAAAAGFYERKAVIETDAAMIRDMAEAGGLRAGYAAAAAYPHLAGIEIKLDRSGQATIKPGRSRVYAAFKAADKSSDETRRQIKALYGEFGTGLSAGRTERMRELQEMNALYQRQLIREWNAAADAFAGE